MAAVFFRTEEVMNSSDNTPGSVTGLEQFLKKLGVRTRDCDFATFRRCVDEAIARGDEAFRPPPSPFWQDEKIEQMVEPHSAVLDIGCGQGDLLARLAEKRRSQVQGIEIDQENVIRCIEHGIPTYHGNAETAIAEFPDGSYDYAVLQNTVQTLHNPLYILNELLRVARRAFISFPNFAHWQVRLAFSLGGRMPVTANLPSTWYNTQNIHLCSINDFVDWTQSAGVRILEAWALANGEVIQYLPEHNLISEHALFMVEKAGSSSSAAG